MQMYYGGLEEPDETAAARRLRAARRYNVEDAADGHEAFSRVAAAAVERAQEQGHGEARVPMTAELFDACAHADGGPAPVTAPTAIKVPQSTRATGRAFIRHGRAPRARSNSRRRGSRRSHSRGGDSGDDDGDDGGDSDGDGPPPSVAQALEREAFRPLHLRRRTLRALATHLRSRSAGRQPSLDREAAR